VAQVADNPHASQALSWVEGQVSVDEELRRLSGAFTERLSAYVDVWRRRTARGRAADADV
jgi:hypothetical protein